MKALSARLATVAASVLMMLGLVRVTASCLPSLDDLNDLFLETAYKQYERAAGDVVAWRVEERR